jgi:hypothetical protein
MFLIPDGLRWPGSVSGEKFPGHGMHDAPSGPVESYVDHAICR